MKNPKLYILSLVFVTLASLLSAQNGSIEMGARGGNNATFGNFGALSLVAQHQFGGNTTLCGGIMQTSYNRFSAEVRPSYAIELPFGRLHFEALLHYTAQSSHHNYAIGGGVGVHFRHLWATLGYYHRTLRSGGERLTEPFNLYYEFGASLLPSVQGWDLTAIFSNAHLFDLERHYLPSLAIDGWWYPSEKVGVRLGACYKPTGIFHISTDYYQLYTNLGVCYRW